MKANNKSREDVTLKFCILQKELWQDNKILPISFSTDRQDPVSYGCSAVTNSQV